MKGWLIALGLVASSIFGVSAVVGLREKETKVALTATQSIYDYGVEFDEASGEYTVTRRYDITGATLDAVIEAAGGPFGATADYTFPEQYVFILHYGRDPYDVTYSQPVTCWPGTKRIVNTTSGGGKTAPYMICTYHGRIKGILSILPHIQMISETLYFNLANTDADRLSIGFNNEGAPRELPMLVYDVTECVDFGTLSVRMKASQEIAGSVNEAGWKAPWLTHVEMADDTKAPVGSYLYMGAGNPIFDRRSQSALITHQFTRIISRQFQQTYPWITVDILPNDTNNGHYYKFAANKTSKIYHIAGTDTGYSGTAIPKFATLFDGLAFTVHTLRPIF